MGDRRSRRRVGTRVGVIRTEPLWSYALSPGSHRDAPVREGDISGGRRSVDVARDLFA